MYGIAANQFRLASYSFWKTRQGALARNRGRSRGPTPIIEHLRCEAVRRDGRSVIELQHRRGLNKACLVRGRTCLADGPASPDGAVGLRPISAKRWGGQEARPAALLCA